MAKDVEPKAAAKVILTTDIRRQYEIQTVY